MAKHIDDVEKSGLPELSKADFYAAMRGGDYLFCGGADGISVPIEKETKSPWSHVLMLWLPMTGADWLTLEATIDKGVHVGIASDYIDGYKGSLVLARRSQLTAAQIAAELIRGLNLLDDRYNWQSEVTFAAHKLVKFLPVANPPKELYCSGLQQVMSRATPYPIVTTGLIPATPEQIWIDPSVEAIGALKQ